MVFWTRGPSEEERGRCAASGGATVGRLFAFDEGERLWADDLSLGGVHVEVSHLLVGTAHEHLDALLVRCDPDPLLLNFAQGIVDAVPAHGADVLGVWKERTRVYPEQLRHNVITRQAQIDHFWRWEMYVDRDNPILRASAAADVVGRLYATLLALNERYGPGLKSPDGLSQRFAIAPASFAERARRSMRVEPAEQAAILAALVDETYDLVEEHVPSVDVERLRRIFRFARTPST